VTPDSWGLPGPSGFLDEAVGALREGVSVVLHLPEHGPEGYGAAVERAIRRDESLAVRRAATDDATQLPSAVLRAALDAEPDAAWLRTPEAVARSGRLVGSVLLVTGICRANWESWRTFLVRFAVEARAHVVGESGQLCLLVSGDVSTTGLDGDPGLRRIAWRDRVSRLDVLLHLGRSWNGEGRSGVERDLRIALAAELAAYDLDLAGRLFAEPLARLLSPQRLLEAEAAQRGWSGRIQGDGWASGRVDGVEGKRLEHGASVAAARDNDELRRRVWRAELGVVFPWLEERRIEIVWKLRDVLTPMESLFGYVERIEDLELAHVLRQVRQKRRGLEWEPRLNAMNRLRRSLAHLEPVDLGDLAEAGVVHATVLAG
jgi:hypothetical protein